MTNDNTYINSRYFIVKKLGNGSMGDVFLIMDTKLNKEWAAKRLQHISDNEIISLKSLNHSSFPRIVDIVDDYPYRWIVMDYIEGTSLRNYLMNNTVSDKQLLKWAKELAEAIYYLHSSTPPILHLDIKPDNLIVCNDLSLKLIDLGSTYFLCSDNPQRISGTASYSSPEQRMGSQVDIRSDVFCYGKTILALLGLNKRSNKNNNHSKNIRLLSSLAEKCTKRDPCKRYQSMKEIMLILENRQSQTYTIWSVSSKSILSNLILFLICFFALISIYTFNATKDYLFLILSLALFILMYSISKHKKELPVQNNIIFDKDLILTKGKKALPLLMLFVLTLALSSLAKVPTMSDSQSHAYRVTIYDEAGYKILYKGQHTEINNDEISVKIPIENITEDTKPAKIECILQ